MLHNNAGGSTSADGPVTEAPDEEFWRLIRLYLYGTFLCSQPAIRKIIEAGGGSVIKIERHRVDDRLDGVEYAPYELG